MPFRPRFWPTLFSVPAVLVMLALGAWQLDRLAWKIGLIDSFNARVDGAAVVPPASVDAIENWRFRRVAANGRFLHDKEIQITGKPFKGTAGFHVITPFVVENGPTVFVNRGWVPADRRRPAARPETLVDGVVRIDGLIREAGIKGRFVPDNEPGNDVWFVVEPTPLAAHLGIEGSVANYTIDVLRPSARPTELPVGAAREIAVRNEHLQYAITWFLLAGTLMVVYVVWHLQTEKAERRRPEDET
ncbi:MAG: SURF1 family protein [Alphaproteobacteria bacterium]|nr:SURF1 family protein [Alphaproteobacteria bacterium]